MNWIDRMAKVVLQSIQEQEKHKTQPLDTVGEVKRVDDDYAWIQFAGATEPTPVKKTISVKKGDKVPVRVSKGSAWIVGNETAPPTDDTLAKKAMSQANNAGRTAKRASDLSIIADVMYYLASDQEEGVTVEDEGWTKEPQEVTESLPYLWAYHDYERGNGTHFKSEPVIIAMYAEDGKGIDTFTTYYALGTSTSTAPTTGWATSFTYLSGYYIWRKELITYDDGTTNWTTAVYDAGLTQSSSLSYDTAQYIWTESTGSTDVPTGQYVTEVSKSSYKSNPTGGALLLRSAGLYLRYAAKTLVELVAAGLKIYEPTDSTNPVAQFLSSGAVIGKENSENVHVDSTGMRYYSGSTEKGKLVGTSDGMSIQSGSGGTWVDLSEQLVEINGGHYAAITVGRTRVDIEDITDTYPCPLYVTGDITTYGSIVAKNIAVGSVSITPTANTPTSKSVSFGKTFPSAPQVVVTPESSVAGTTLTGWAVTNITTTGFTAWVTRGNTTSTTLHWIAIG